MFYELSGTQLAQPLVKGQAQYVINATRLEQGPLITQRRNARRCFQWPQVLAGQWLEGHHCRLHIPRVRLGFQMREYRLMAQVHTVERANRHRASAVLGSQIMPTADEFHPRLFPSNTRSQYTCRRQGDQPHPAITTRDNAVEFTHWTDRRHASATSLCRHRFSANTLHPMRHHTTLGLAQCDSTRDH